MYICIFKVCSNRLQIETMGYQGTSWKKLVFTFDIEIGNYFHYIEAQQYSKSTLLSYGSHCEVIPIGNLKKTVAAPSLECHVANANIPRTQNYWDFFILTSIFYTKEKNWTQQVSFAYPFPYLVTGVLTSDVLCILLYRIYFIVIYE